MKKLVVEFAVTEECNLSCTYCYMHNKKKEHMTIEKVYNFIDSVEVIMKEYNTDKYHISYFGGEPLINWDTVKESITYKLTENFGLNQNTTWQTGKVPTYKAGIVITF